MCNKKTAGKSVEQPLESADTMGCAGDVKSKYLFSTENDQSIWWECLSQVLPFIQHCWHFNATLVNTDIYPSHQSFQWGEYSPGGQSSLRSYGCSIQSNERVSRSANCMPSGRWATQRRMGSIRKGEQRDTNETPHTCIVAKYDNLESWRKIQVRWWRWRPK